MYSRQTYNLYLISASEYGGMWVSGMKKVLTQISRRTVGRRGFGRADYWATKLWDGLTNAVRLVARRRTVGLLTPLNEMVEVVKILFDNWVDCYCHSYSRTHCKNPYVTSFGQDLTPHLPLFFIKWRTLWYIDYLSSWYLIYACMLRTWIASGPGRAACSSYMRD